jgi:hypothetical protein
MGSPRINMFDFQHRDGGSNRDSDPDGLDRPTLVVHGNGFRTARVPKHTDYYSAERRGAAPGSRPAGRNFRNSLRVRP